MFRPRRPLISVPAFPSSDLCASGFGSLPSFCSGGSSGPFTRPFAPAPSNCLPLALRNEGNEVKDLLFLSYPRPAAYALTQSKTRAKIAPCFHALTDVIFPNSFLSYSYKFQGGVFLLPQGLVPSFVLLARFLSHRNCRKPFPFIHLLHNSRTPQGGTANSFPSRAFRAMNPGCPLPCFSILGPVAYKSGAPTKSSPRASANSVSLRYPFPRSSFQLSTVDCQPRPSNPFPSTSHKSPVTASRTSTLPPPNYGIIPPHRGVSRSSLTTGRNPIRTRGGFSD
jgi:hypothetical protein